MKDFSVDDIFASVKCEFVRRCSHSDTILTRLADDFIGRYSVKSRPHPQFFKEDAALTHNQLIIYADECVQVMRKFDFLHRGADIVHSLATSALRLLDFFTKQLYHYMREAPPNVPTIHQESLCPSCGRLRENERVRSLREQLSMGERWGEGQVMLREMVVRHGQKYDEQELLYESLQNLEVLNEEEIRKRLGKMQADHDKRKKEILVAVEELTRANQRVSTYSRALQRSGKEFSGKFNVKDYVFQLGRHFYHNISNLDLKIRLLKQSLSPIAQQETQTQIPIMLESAHNQIMATVTSESEKIKDTLGEAIRSLTIEQNKNSELQQMNALLQQKMQENQIKREEAIIEERVNSTQISNNLAAAESKIALLEALLRKLKGGKNKNGEAEAKTGREEPTSNEDKLNTNRQEPPSQKLHRTNTSKTITHIPKEKQSFLINPKLLLRMSSFKSASGSKSATQQFSERLLNMIPTAPEMLAQICEQARLKFSLVATINQTYIPIPKISSSKAVSRRVSSNILTNPHESLHISEAPSRQEINLKDRYSEMEPIHHKEKLKLTKIDANKPEYIRSNKHRESIYVDDEAALDNLKKKATDRPLAFQDIRNTFDEKYRLPTKKMLGSIKTSLGLQTFKSVHDKEALRKQFAQRILLQKRNRHKKARNLSQQNSYEQTEYQELRRSIQKMQYKDRQVLGEKERRILLNPTDSQAKMNIKGSLHRSECARIVLSLEEINYSTYFYSLLANIHLKSQSLYENVRKFMVSLVPGLHDDDNSIKESLSCLLLAHRRCTSGSICHHLETFLEKVRGI